MPGPQELLVIAVIALLVFGPDRLPEMMRQAARLLARFREQSQQSIDELKRAAELDELNSELRSLRREARSTAASFEQEVADAQREVAQAAGEAGGPQAGAPATGPPPMDPEAT